MQDYLLIKLFSSKTTLATFEKIGLLFISASDHDTVWHCWSCYGYFILSFAHSFQPAADLGAVF